MFDRDWSDPSRQSAARLGNGPGSGPPRTTGRTQLYGRLRGRHATRPRPIRPAGARDEAQCWHLKMAEAPGRTWSSSGRGAGPSSARQQGSLRRQRRQTGLRRAGQRHVERAYIVNMATQGKNADGTAPVVPPCNPAAVKVFQYRQETKSKDDPEGFCLPPGIPRMMYTPYPTEIFQMPDRILFIYEGGAHVWRMIWMDGRKQPGIPIRITWDIQWATGKATRWWSTPLG